MRWEGEPGDEAHAAPARKIRKRVANGARLRLPVGKGGISTGAVHRRATGGGTQAGGKYAGGRTVEPSGACEGDGESHRAGPRAVCYDTGCNWAGFSEE